MNWLGHVFLAESAGFEADFFAFLPAARAHAAAFLEDAKTTFAVAGREARE